MLGALMVLVAGMVLVIHPFGSLSVLIGFIAFLLPMLFVDKKLQYVQIALQVIALIAGLIAGYYSGSRAILLVVVGVFFSVAYYSKFSLIKVAVLTALIFVFSASVLMLGQNKLSNRIHECE
jgi:hypothetical protein